MELITRAATFAREAHGEQQRKDGTPYIDHPGRVAELVAEAGCDEATIAAAWLHDVIEDTEVTAEELRAEFGNEVTENVLAVSEDATLTWNERWRARLAQIIAGPIGGRAIACADRIDNLTDLLAMHAQIGKKTWTMWPERSPQEKLASDRAYLNALRTHWPNPLVERLAELVDREAAIIEDA